MLVQLPKFASLQGQFTHHPVIFINTHDSNSFCNCQKISGSPEKSKKLQPKLIHRKTSPVLMTKPKCKITETPLG